MHRIEGSLKGMQSLTAPVPICFLCGLFVHFGLSQPCLIQYMVKAVHMVQAVQVFQNDMTNSLRRNNEATMERGSTVCTIGRIGLGQFCGLCGLCWLHRIQSRQSYVQDNDTEQGGGTHTPAILQIRACSGQGARSVALM